MTVPAFDEVEESAGPMLAWAPVDRAAHVRGDLATLREMWSRPDARVLRLDGMATTLRSDRGGIAWSNVSAEEEVAAVDSGSRYFLGMDADGIPYFAVDRPFAPEAGESVISLRAIGPWLPAVDAGLLTHAVALSAWHRRHRFCSQCGATTLPSPAGHSRVCEGCQVTHRPRIDPAVVVLVIDADDRLLLARNVSWPAGQMSTLAGFMEAGESAEQAVTREILEEAGLVVDRLQYEGSQSWPFPAAAMFAFRAHARNPELHVDAREIAEARWYARDELIEAMEQEEVRLPSSVSVARWQIERWYGGALPDEHDW